MSVTVRTHGMARVILRDVEITLDMAGNSIRDLIDQLAAQYGQEVREQLLDEQGNLDYAYLFLIGGERVDSPSHKVEDGDEIMIASMLGGG